MEHLSEGSADRPLLQLSNAENRHTIVVFLFSTVKGINSSVFGIVLKFVIGNLDVFILF